MSPKRIHFVVAAFAVLLFGLRLLLWLFPTTVTQLPVTRHLILLLVPGLSTDSAENRHDTPVFTSLMHQCPVALLKVTPKETFAHACARIAARTQPPQTVQRTLAGSDDALPLAGEGSHILFSEDWRKPDPDAADGYAIHLDAFGSAIKEALPAKEDSASTMVVAVYDDLDNARQYAPLALPNVSRDQRRHALRQFDRLLDLLTDKQKAILPENTMLLVASPTGTDTERFTPLLLWKAQGLSAGLLTLPGKGAIAGILPGEALLPMVSSLLGASTSIRPPVLQFGNIASLLYRADALSVREQNRAYLFFVLAVPVGGALLSLILRFAGQKRVAESIAITVVATPLLLDVAGSIASRTTMDLSVVAIIFALLVFICAFLVSDAYRRGSIPAICLLSLATLTVDALSGGWLALATPLALRPETTWGILAGALLLAVYPLLPQSKFLIPVLWIVVIALLFPLCGPAASVLCLLYGTGILPVTPPKNRRRK